MARNSYSAEFKTKIVLALLQGDKDFNEICTENNLNPGVVRRWRQEFLDNSHKVFSDKAEKKVAQRKEDDLKKKNSQMLKTIG